MSKIGDKLYVAGTVAGVDATGKVTSIHIKKSKVATSPTATAALSALDSTVDDGTGTTLDTTLNQSTTSILD